MTRTGQHLGIEASTTPRIPARRPLSLATAPPNERPWRHRTQITVLDAKTFEYSNKVPQKISAVETYRVLDGDPTRTVNPKPQEAGLVSTVLTGVILGTVAAVAGSIYHAWVVCTQAMLPCPWAWSSRT